MAGFDFKLFYDQELTNEYLSSQDSTNFNVIGIGTIGIGTSPDLPIVGAALTVQYSIHPWSIILWFIKRRIHKHCWYWGAKSWWDIIHW